MSRSDQKEAMHEYLDALLFDEVQPSATQVAENDQRELERLLAQTALRQQETQQQEQAKAQEQERIAALERQQEAKMAAQLAAQEEAREKAAKAAQVEAEREAQRAAQQAPALVDVPPPPVSNMDDYKQGDFQALFFSVAGLKLAVPLKSLGGIHQWKEPNTIFGKPDWYLGIMTNREEKLNVVDTARWVMPEKYTPELAEQLKYQYLIMLGESRWGLGCESLVTTEALSPSDVQWRKGENSKRPWLAGVVREKMCAILDVDAMVEMLEKGLNSQD